VFRYRVKNIVGWSPDYSPELTILAASKPDAPDSVTTSINGINVVIDWNAPSENGATISSYVIEILDGDGTWVQDTSYCDGADATVKADTQCSVPMSVLRDADGLYRLERDESVSARISAINVLGTSDLSDLPSVMATLQTLPAAPTGLSRGDYTTETLITLEWSELTTSEELGGIGVAITSYHVEWQPSSSLDSWAELAGYSSAFISVSFTTEPLIAEQALTSGEYYKF
jgi:hypothetical protein